AVVRDAAVTTAGYQGTPSPNQWFGGPALSPGAGNMVLRDAAGLVVDSLNYGLLVDPWAAEGYQAASGSGQSGCRVPAIGLGGGRGGARITVTAPLTLAHTSGAQVSGSGITLTGALTRAHASGAQVASNVPTPGAPNQYYRRGR